MTKNYQLITDEIINKIKSDNIKPKLLLHSCCAPCSTYVLEYLSNYFNISVLFYNPNIDSQAEFNLRANELQRLINEMNLNINIIVIDYEPSDFFNAVKGFEHHKEGGLRCEKCFKLRLQKTAECAKDKGFDYFVTSLSISPLKNSQSLNEIGIYFENMYNVKYLLSDFKKREGYKRSLELSKIHNLYRQNYCACIFSKKQSNNI